MSATKKISVLIADDHTLVRRALATLLSLNKEIQVVAEVGDGREAVKLVGEYRPDVVLMDLSMPNLNGFEAIRQIRRLVPTTKILVVSAHDNEDYVLQTIQNGADGYFLKSTSPEELGIAIRTVHEGRRFFSKNVAGFAQQVLSNMTTGISPREARDASQLTSREREILQLIAEAHTHQEIAEMLHISVRTVDTHRNNIIQKLGLHDTASLVTYAIRTGIVIVPR